MDFPLEVEKGEVLEVPVLSCSPVAYELEVAQTFPMDDGEVLLCKIRNVLMEESLKDDSRTMEERIRSIAPISTTCQTYFSWEGKSLGEWGEPKGSFQPEK